MKKTILKDKSIIVAIIGGIILFLSGALFLANELIDVGLLTNGKYYFFVFHESTMSFYYSFVDFACVVSAIILAATLLSGKRSAGIIAPVGIFLTCVLYRLVGTANYFLSMLDNGATFLEAAPYLLAILSAFLISISLIVMILGMLLNTVSEKSFGFAKIVVIIAALLYMFGYGAYFIFDVINTLPSLDYIWSADGFTYMWNNFLFYLIKPVTFSFAYLLAGIGITLAGLWTAFKPSPKAEIEA